MMADHLRHHRPNQHLASAFGDDRFGQLAERFARFFGTPRFLIGQTCFLIVWIVVNGDLLHFGVVWDVYPFILANLGLSMQAAYAAPLILLASTRQAARQQASDHAAARHRQEEADRLIELLEHNTDLTSEVKRLTREVHELVATGKTDSAGPRRSPKDSRRL